MCSSSTTPPSSPVDVGGDEKVCGCARDGWDCEEDVVVETTCAAGDGDDDDCNVDVTAAVDVAVVVEAAGDEVIPPDRFPPTSSFPPSGGKFVVEKLTSAFCLSPPDA